MAQIRHSLPALLAELDTDPIYQLSLNRKELFHSNLLAWLATHFTAEAVEVFGPWSPQAGDGHRGREIADRETGASPMRRSHDTPPRQFEGVHLNYRICLIA